MAPVAIHEPVVVVAWHAEALEGPMLAEQIYSWLRPGSGLGPRVRFAASPAVLEDLAKRLCEPTPVQLLVVMLIDEYMVIDADWRAAVSRVFARGGNPPTRPSAVPLPVALDRHALGFPPLRTLNFIRPVGAKADIVSTTLPEQAWLEHARVRSLLRQLTDALARFMTQENLLSQGAAQTIQKPSGGNRVRVFISHAKENPDRAGAGGTGPATEVRDFIRSSTQLDSFYDENDIPFADDFASQINDGLTGAEAMIVVQTERYAWRPWCRYEVGQFRQPVRVFKDANVYAIKPVLVIDAMSPMHHSRCVPELGSSPLVGWDASRKTETAELAVMTLLRSVFLNHVHLRQLCSLRQVLESDPAVSSKFLYLSWLPDLSSLSDPRIQSALNDPHTKIVHPGNTLVATEANILRGLREQGLPLVGFADIEPAKGVSPEISLNAFGVAWSASIDDSNDLLARGLGRQHIEAFVGRMIGLLLRRGATILYAGVWELPSTTGSTKGNDHKTLNNMLRMILQGAVAEQRWPTGVDGEQSNQTLDEPIVNHLPWPNRVDVSLQAKWVGICRVLPQSIQASGLPYWADAGNKAHKAIALAAARRRQLDWEAAGSPDARVGARIVMGGKIRGYSGIAPGLLEECVLSLLDGHQVWILGGFGGMAGWISDVLWPRSTRRTFSSATEAIADLRKGQARLPVLESEVQSTLALYQQTEGSHPFTRHRFMLLDELVQQLWAVRERIEESGAGIASILRTGLDDSETIDLMTTSDPDYAIRLLSRANRLPIR